MFVDTSRKNVLLVCPANDPEAHMILLLAEKMGLATIRSKQEHGATLEKEPDIVERILASEKPEVWTVEMPGPVIEEALSNKGLTVRIIDHHTYGTLDRASDAETGAKKLSSLEQFLELAKVTDDELRGWGFNPKAVRGLGIFDDRYVQGLRDAGYTPEDIADVMKLSQTFLLVSIPNYAEIVKAAEKAWAEKEEWNGYTLVRSDAPVDIRGAVGRIGIREGIDNKPLIVSSRAGRKIFVHNAGLSVIERLKRELPSQDTFTFGSGRCWGYDSRGKPPKITLTDVLRILSSESAIL